jgi:hypothetical protein
MTGVFRLYRLAASPTTSRHTPPPMAIKGSLRLSKGKDNLRRSRERKFASDKHGPPVEADMCRCEEHSTPSVLQTLKEEVRAKLTASAKLPADERIARSLCCAASGCTE